MMPIFNHPTFSELADLAEGRTSPDESAARRSHTASCSQCSAKLARLEQVIGLMRADKAEDAPATLISRAVSLFRSRARDTYEPSLVRRIVAALSFDSFQMSPAYGVRSGQAAARQLLYSIGERDLDLRVTQTNDAWAISGQILGADCAGGQIELHGGATVHSVDLNDQCEFLLPPIPAGSYQLRLHLGDTEYEIPELELKA